MNQIQNVKQRKEVAVRNNPGIAKEFFWCEQTSKWKETGKYRATRRVRTHERSKRETCFFDNLEEAKLFRQGLIEKRSNGGHHKTYRDSQLFSFKDLVKEWSEFHFLKIELSSRQFYERKLKALTWLNRYPVAEITPQVIDQLIKHLRETNQNMSRLSFEKELDTLKVILNFYRKRKDPRFPVPIYREHFEAATLLRKAKGPVKTLNPEQLSKFFQKLRAHSNSQYFSIALTQFALGLRIGEACALRWDALNLENQTVIIDSTVVWDQESWKPIIKERPKNGHVRVLSIPEILNDELKNLKAQREPNVSLVFHNHGGPLIRKTIGQAYNRALKACGIVGLSGTHLLRRTSATQANRLTNDFWAVSRNLGHLTLSETERYVGEVAESKVKVAAALNEVAKVALGSQWPASDVVSEV